MAYRTITKAILAAGLAIGATSAMAADSPKLKMGASTSMLVNTCIACHGTDGASLGPASPSIGGLSKDYFIETMQGFADGEIQSTIMGRIAKGYTEDEIKQMSDFFGAQTFAKATQSFDKKLVKKGAKLHDKYCEKCHAEGGQSAEDDAGVLAGQWTPYVSWQLSNYQEGGREMTKKMKKRLNKMLAKEGSAGIEALLNFYASQK